MTTAEDLVKSCLRDEHVSFPVYMDYFGNASEPDDITTVLGMYQRMVLRGVTAELLHNCLLSNRLNELVHAMHTWKRIFTMMTFARTR